MMIVEERNFIRKAMEEQGLALFDYYEDHQVFSVKEFHQLTLARRSEVLLVDAASFLNHPKELESCLTLINTFDGVIFFYEEGDQNSKQWVQTQAGFQSKILGAFSLPMPELNWTFLSNQLHYFWTVKQELKQLQRHMAEFSQELDQVLQSAEWEMNKAKKLHEKLVPKRSDEIKGINFLNKYATGDSGGGEFYDLHQSGNKVFQILFSSESYLISSSLMGLWGQHKAKDFDPTAFLKNAKADIETINASKKKKAKVELTLLELELSNLTLKSLGEDNSEFYGQNGQVKLSAGETYKLAKAEKFIVFSPGFIFNWNEGDHKQDIYSFIKDHQRLSREELMTELFFQIRQEKGSQFLKKDATVVMMEVNRHGMHQV